MATFKDVGPLVSGDTSSTKSLDLVDVDYVNTLLAANLSSGAVTTRINSNLSGFATASYLTSALAPLATPAYVRAQAANYVPLSSIGTPLGPIPLSVGGRVSPGLISAPSTQQWPTPFYSPTGYQTTAVTTDAAVQLFTMAQPYPGYNYRMMCTGIMDAQVPTTDDPTVFPEILVRQGSITGPIIAFGYGLAESYRFGIASLGGANSTQLGNTTGWAQYYSSTGSGAWATPSAGVASWVTTGDIFADPSASCRCRCLDTVFGKSIGAYQAVSMTLASTAGGAAFGGNGPTNDIYVRMDDTGTYYVRCAISNGSAALTYSLGGSEVAIGSSVSVSETAGMVFTLYAGNLSTSAPRQFQLYKTVGSTTTLVGTWNDTNNASALGAPYQGWGFGASLGSGFFGTSSPASVSSVSLSDPANPAIGVNSGEIVILPTALAGQTTQTASTTLYVMAQSANSGGAADNVTISTVQPGLVVVPLPWAA